MIEFPPRWLPRIAVLPELHLLGSYDAELGDGQIIPLQRLKHRQRANGDGAAALLFVPAFPQASEALQMPVASRKNKRHRINALEDF